MLIHPDGLLNGNRIRACSDEAQLHFPRILAASNTCGRFRMSIDWLQNEVYGGFKSKPTKEQLTAWLREYYDNFLLFVYWAGDGSRWAQWDIPKRMQSRYPLAADRATPAPNPDEFEAFRNAYIEMVRLRNVSVDQDELGDCFGEISHGSAGPRNVPQVSEKARRVSRGIGVGVGFGSGVGVGVNTSPALPEHTPEEPEKATDQRHVPFREAVHDHWRATVPNSDAAPWDGSEAKALTNLLRANPNLTLEQFATCLRHRSQSTVQASDRPRRWLETVTDYLSGPKDEFGKPLRPKAREPGTRSRAVPSSAETRDRLKREDEERQKARDEVLEFWAHCKEHNPEKYRDVPNWARQELERVQ